MVLIDHVRDLFLFLFIMIHLYKTKTLMDIEHKTRFNDVNFFF